MSFCKSGSFFVLFVALWAGANADGRQLCSELVNSDSTSDVDKRNAQLCRMAEMSDVVEGIANALSDELTSLLNAQGITVDDEAVSSTEPAGEVGKRKNEFLRYGKRKNEYLRFGKRKNEYLRFGKRKNEYLRFGK